MADLSKHSDSSQPVTTKSLPDVSASDYCSLSRRVDGKKHSWTFDGDDPYIECGYCGQYRDSISSHIIRQGRGNDMLKSSPDTKLRPSESLQGRPQAERREG